MTVIFYQPMWVTSTELSHLINTQCRPDMTHLAHLFLRKLISEPVSIQPFLLIEANSIQSISTFIGGALVILKYTACTPVICSILALAIAKG